MDMLTSDTAILLFSCAGLLTTAISIVRDTTAQRRRATMQPSVEQIAVFADSRELAA